MYIMALKKKKDFLAMTFYSCKALLVLHLQERKCTFSTMSRKVLL